MNTITLTEHAAISYACGFTLFGSLAGILSYRFALWVQARDNRRAKTWERTVRKSSDQRFIDEAITQVEERNRLRALARKVRPE